MSSKQHTILQPLYIVLQLLQPLSDHRKKYKYEQGKILTTKTPLVPFQTGYVYLSLFRFLSEKQRAVDLRP